ncbi:PREDICTED: alpha- and gamma-adaptin-binding protein p34-like [Ceratosolen solmsi marchali]|uniref:Alpha- and gamma-adaptin-binding protein p34-like n=1 Tax=Ceratosolen solmsi marchali TaxID=326594 RepID=A0AAJ7DWY1_9HYME|nr:PREDICTED: alpha- and gamma-adaptin-binding protein p34-like [Ceratosolen solmsi marchali]
MNAHTAENMNAEMNLPRVLISNSKRAKAKEIASKMGAKYLSQQADMETYLLDIDNKYYTAQILLCTTDNLSINLSNFEALIFHYDLETGDSFRLMSEQIVPLLDRSEAEILLLVCNSIPNATVREQVLEWCALRKFELIELEHSDPVEIMELEEDQSKYGIERIVEALETHMWPNINLKNCTRKNTQGSQFEVNEVGDQLENVCLSNAQDISERLQMESVLDGIMNNEGADFGELFCHLRAMKEHAASMPSNQRRVAAEQLVTAFWKAIGGDPSEVEEIN